MLKVAICGGSGYTGIELLRILAGHPRVRVVAVTSEKSAGRRLTELFPHLHAYRDMAYEPMEKERLLPKADLFFLALPHAASQEAGDYFFGKGKRVVDLSADYRLADAEVYESWYGVPHQYRRTLARAVYGLPEIHRARIRKTRLIANPGCYPTGAILGLMPAVKSGLVETSSLVIDSKSGTSGAGRKADVAVAFCEVNEGFKAYGIGTHRHTPEIEQEISALAGQKVTLNFTPHLLPVDRGILTTIYGKMTKKISQEQILAAYQKAYRNEPFIRLLPPGVYPNIKNVRGTNFCEMGLKLNSRTDTLIIVTAIDNLVKGAAGQAVHNMNIMMGFDETSGLGSIGLYP